MTHARRPTLHRRFGWAWAFALALVFAQGLALAHGVLHARAGVVLEHDPFDAHHAGDTDCRLVDQLAHADALPAAAVPLPALPPVARPATAVPRSHAVAFAAAYCARAPPRG